MFTDWITRIVLFLILAMIADALLPSGLMKKYARLVMSILLLLIFLGPLLQVLNVDPESIMKSAEYKMNQQIDATLIEENIEKKKKEILQGQDAYKLEQVTQALASEIEKPMKEDHHLMLVDLEMTFQGDSYDLGTLDKLTLTLASIKEEAPVQLVDINIMEQTDTQNEKDDAEVKKWIAEKVGLKIEQIEIRWEDEDE